MFIRYFVFICLFVIFSCSSKPKNCSKFKKGTFKYKNSSYSNWIVTRNDSIQTEIDKLNSIKIIGKIKWLSDCRYILTYTDISDLEQKNVIGTTVDVEILSTNNDSYKCIAINNESTLNLNMIKISE